MHMLDGFKVQDESVHLALDELADDALYLRHLFRVDLAFEVHLIYFEFGFHAISPVPQASR